MHIVRIIQRSSAALLMAGLLLIPASASAANTAIVGGTNGPCLVGEPYVTGARIRLGVDRDDGKAEPARRARDAARDLSAVGDEQSTKHALAWGELSVEGRKSIARCSYCPIVGQYDPSHAEEYGRVAARLAGLRLLFRRHRR